MLNKLRYNRDQLLVTAVTILLLCAVIITMIGYVYRLAEEEAYTALHLETQQIKNDISLQFVSDRENLITMANFAAKLYADGEPFDLVFDSFKPMGLIENVGILLPDNRFLTKNGELNVSGSVSFEQEMKKDLYVSGRIKDITNPKLEMIRSAAPITVEGETVAILYGSINLDTLSNRYEAEIARLGADFYLIEGGNGNFLVDTSHERLGNITALSTISYENGYSYHEMISALTEGMDGYSAYRSPSTGEVLYVHFSPVGVSDWRIMLSKPENIVFAGAKATGGFLATMFFIVILIMAGYLWLLLMSSDRRGQVNAFASQIRKYLLDLNRRIDSIEDALNRVRVFSKARSAFFVDSFGEDHNDIDPELENLLLTGQEREYFIKKLLGYASQGRVERRATVQVIKIELTAALKRQTPDFYEFLKARNIKVVHFAGVADYGNNISLIGTINPKNNLVEVLLKDIAVCFSMAVYNKKHLLKTETMALTDSLTGLANRMSYKQDCKSVLGDSIGVLSCVYIDVNELHYFNNKYGHVAGDQMLVFISETLGEEFFDSKVYRMGGDEFLIFSRGLSRVTLEERMKKAKNKIEEMKYYISYGMASMEDYSEIEDMVNEAEKLMYEDKNLYYQSKKSGGNLPADIRQIETVVTGDKGVDAFLSVFAGRYRGVYCVSLQKDRATQVVAPSHYFRMDKENTPFSDIMKNYIHDMIQPEFQRSVLKLLDYEILERQLKHGHVPKVEFSKNDGVPISLTVYLTSPLEAEETETIWVFEREKR